jgi:small ligand-binding sensory domain FIST
MVAGLTDELSESADTSLHVLSEEFGVLNGTQPIVDTTEPEHDGSDDLWETAQKELLTAAGEADVMVILLSTNTFEKTASKIWPELVEEAKPDSIWCLGAARSTLDSIDFDELEAKGCSVITYQRVGVARIGTETREDLLQAVTQKASE